jgi:hypothetical protein
MIRTVCLLALLLPALALAPSTAAQETVEEAEQPQRWGGSVELNVTDQAGNQEMRVLIGGIDLRHLQREDFRLDLSYETRYGRSEGEVIARNHYGSIAFDLTPEETVSPFLFADAERDPFKRLAARLSGGAGAKYTAWSRERGEGSISLGLLYSREDFTPTAEGERTPSRSVARWSLRVRGDEQLRPGANVRHTSFFQPVWGEMADYLLRSETSLRIRLMERLALNVGLQMNRNSTPPEGVRPDDRVLKTGLVVDF